MEICDLAKQVATKVYDPFGVDEETKRKHPTYNGKPYYVDDAEIIQEAIKKAWLDGANWADKKSTKPHVYGEIEEAYKQYFG